MYTLERLSSIDKSDIPEVSKALKSEELPQLVEWLSEKDDDIRFRSFLLLQSRSALCGDVYPFWDAFCEKLYSENSYQRSIGLMLIAENAKWDKEDKLNKILDEYLKHLNDEKPITIRQCIQSLQKIVPYKKNIHFQIAEKLMALDISSIKETMRRSILFDILNVFVLIRKYRTNDEIESYLLNALNGGLIDKKAKKQIELLM